MEASEQAFRIVVRAMLDRASAKGHEVPEDILSSLYEAVAAGDRVRVDFICPRCWGDLRIVYDDETISLAGSLLAFQKPCDGAHCRGCSE